MTPNDEHRQRSDRRKQSRGGRRTDDRPGFSPLVGTALATYPGWRFIFGFVGAFAIALAVLYWRSVAETHPADRRTSLTLSDVASIYRDRENLEAEIAMERAA